jgi:hypothetical protein
LSFGILSVLWVLTRQTLEINTEVKDPFFPDPSLAKVVKDPTLVILYNIQHSYRYFLEEGQNCWRVLFKKGVPSTRDRFDLANSLRCSGFGGIWLVILSKGEIILALLGVFSLDFIILGARRIMAEEGRILGC